MQKLIEIAKKVLNFEVNENSKLGEESWDSLAHINLFMAIEEEFNIKFTPEEIMQTTTIKDILRLIESKKNV
jgi:acyl carrier protein